MYVGSCLGVQGDWEEKYVVVAGMWLSSALESC